MEYVELFEELYQNKVKYLICGGLAVNLYGIPRMTADIDILLEFEADNLQAFQQVIKKLSYQPHLPIAITELTDKAQRDRLIKEKNLIAYSFFNRRANYMSLDVLVNAPFPFNDLWQRKNIREMNDFKVYLTSIDDLIEMKKLSGRTQDEKDIQLLSQIKQRNGE